LLEPICPPDLKTYPSVLSVQSIANALDSHPILDFVYQYWDELYTSEQGATSNITKHQE